tara:strand:- start:823 stop:1029 length:207 start_codon:yes stop_codon:yes gene_type:complete
MVWVLNKFNMIKAVKYDRKLEFDLTVYSTLKDELMNDDDKKNWWYWVATYACISLVLFGIFSIYVTIN